MYKDPKINDLIENTHSWHIARVIEVNEQYSWFKAQYLDGLVKEYRILTSGNSSFVKLTAEQRADFLLELEKAGITDYWREE